MEGSLTQSLSEKNEYFKRMTNLIPPQFYFDKEAKPVVTEGKYFKNKAEKAPNQQRKELTKKGANKLKRLDPSQHKTVTEEIQKITQEEEEGDNEDSSDDEAGDEDKQESEDEGVHSGSEEPMAVIEEEAEPKTKRKKKTGQALKPVSVEKVRTGASLDDLREKLQERIAELRLKRRAPGGEGQEGAPPKKLSKKMKEVERKKKEKMESIQASKKKLHDALRDKAKLKEAKENGTSEPVPDDGKVLPKEEISFSKFKFEENDFAKARETKKKNKKKRDEPRSGKDYVRLLAKVEKHKQHLTELKEKNPEKAQEVITKEKWQKAINKAEGVKIKDDPELLKKSMKRQQAHKKRSTKEWKSRGKLTEKLVKGKQDKRDKNIQRRKDKKKAKKVKRLQKKGKLLLQD